VSEYKTAADCLRAHGFQEDADFLAEIDEPTPYQKWVEQHGDNARGGNWLEVTKRGAWNYERYRTAVLATAEKRLHDAWKRQPVRTRRKPQDVPETKVD
jgi:hypothetical protein